MSIGFWVATNMNGSGSRWLTPSTVTVDSSASSSSADCVRGVARLSSSNTTMLANTGPGRNVMPSTSSWPLGTIEPVMSPGRRSDVPWIRWKVPPTARARTWASSVLPTPGMSSIRRWPPAEQRGDAHFDDVVFAGDDGVHRADQPSRRGRRPRRPPARSPTSPPSMGSRRRRRCDGRDGLRRRQGVHVRSIGRTDPVLNRRRPIEVNGSRPRDERIAQDRYTRTLTSAVAAALGWTRASTETTVARPRSRR